MSLSTYRAGTQVRRVQGPWLLLFSVVISHPQLSEHDNSHVFGRNLKLKNFDSLLTPYFRFINFNCSPVSSTSCREDVSPATVTSTELSILINPATLCLASVTVSRDRPGSTPGLVTDVRKGSLCWTPQPAKVRFFLITCVPFFYNFLRCYLLLDWDCSVTKVPFSKLLCSGNRHLSKRV